MQQQPAYLNPHQARDREPDDYQNLLGDAIERAYAAGIHDLDEPGGEPQRGRGAGAERPALERRSCSSAR